MNYPFRVGCIESVRHFNAQIQYGFQFHRTATDTVLQRHAVHEFHGNESSAVFLTDFVNRADVRMIQCRSRLRFSPEPLQCLVVFCYFIGQEFERDESVQAYVFGLIDDTHPSAT